MKFIKPFPFWAGNYHQISSFSFTVWNHKLLYSILLSQTVLCFFTYFHILFFSFSFLIINCFFTWKVEKSCRKQMSAQVPLWSRYNNIPKKREKLNLQMRPFTSSEIFLSFLHKALVQNTVDDIKAIIESTARCVWVFEENLNRCVRHERILGKSSLFDMEFVNDAIK